MKKTTSAPTLILVLLLSAVTTANLGKMATADPLPVLPYITIESDGSINPQTEYIKQNGITYTLTDNLADKYAIIIKCSNIVFDGAGYRIRGTSTKGYANRPVSLDQVTNVTVKDVQVAGFGYNEIRLESCVSCSILRVKTGNIAMHNSSFNTIAENSISSSLFMHSSSNNRIVRNTVIGDRSSLDFANGNSNVLFENNFACKYYYINGYNLWDNSSVGNYWSNYNGTDADGNGIGDTPFIINAGNSDNYPLIAPVDTIMPSIKVLSPENETYDTSIITLNFTVNESAHIAYNLDGEEITAITGNTTLTGLANGDHNLTLYATDEAGNTGASETIYFNVEVPERLTAALVIAASGASVAVVIASLFFYFKKRVAKRR